MCNNAIVVVGKKVKNKGQQNEILFYNQITLSVFQFFLFHSGFDDTNNNDVTSFFIIKKT